MEKGKTRSYNRPQAHDSETQSYNGIQDALKLIHLFFPTPYESEAA